MGQSDHPFLEILHKGIDGAESAVKGVRAISASEAFRKFNWLKNVPKVNMSGNLRGMVVSARWRSVFTVANKIEKPLGNIAIVVGLATNLAQSAARFESIYKGKQTWDTKAQRMCTETSSAIVRTLGGFIPGASSIAFEAAKGYCMMGAVAIGHGDKGTRQCISEMDAADSYVSTNFNRLTDGNNWYLWINSAIGL